MSDEKRETRSYQFSHMLLLVSFTLLVIALVGETFLLEWETWPLVPIVLSVVVCWLLHIQRTLTDTQRLWVYSIAMMCTFFFYGVHVTSTYDLAMVIIGIMMLFTTTGQPGLVRMAVATYFVTLAFDLAALIAAGTQWDGLMITRTALHVAIVILGGWVGQIIIRQWATLFYKADGQLADLHAATKRMNMFMANLSHELRTPLNVILGITGGLRGTEGPEDLRSGMRTILAAGRRMEVQTDDILNYSELATGGLVINPQPCMLSSVLNDLVGSLQFAIPAELELVIDVDPQIPAILVTDSEKLKKILWHLISNSLKYSKSGGAYVRIGCVRHSYGINLMVEVTDTGVGMTSEELEKVFNQFYHADSGRSVNSGGLGIGLSITGGFVRALGGFITVSSEPGVGTTFKVSLPMAVEDDRSCMALESAGDVVVGGYFNFLKYPDTRVRDYYNIMVKNLVQGLGVTMHRANDPEELINLDESCVLTHLFVGAEEYQATPELVERLAQRMTVAVVARDASVLPAGSSAHLVQKPFYCFPVINILRMSSQQERMAAEVLRCPGVRALVVDDEPMNLQVAVSLLKRYDMDVTTAASGQAALALCANSAFDIIFMDHMMPEMDGLEAMKRIRRENGGKYNYIPIVMLTANTLSASRGMFERAGVDGFVPKPVDITELERVLKRLLPASALRYEPAGEAGKPEVAEPPRPEPTLADSLAPLGVDVREGLSSCLDDKAFYLELLSQYAAEAPEKAQSLAQFFESGDFEGYLIVAHALKSTSKLIGADAVSQMARALEEAARNADARRIESLHPAFLEAYQELAHGIASAVGAGPEESYEILEFMPDGEDES